MVKRFRRHRGWWPNIACPHRYVERMFWRKVVDHNPLFETLVDKLKAKNYIRQRSPDLKAPETLWTGDDANAIPDEILRGDVWVKGHHGSGFNLHVVDGAIDRGELKRVTDEWLGRVYGRVLLDWASEGVRARLMVEKSIVSADRPLWEFEIRAASGRFVLGSMVTDNKRPEMWRAFLDAKGDPVVGPGDMPGTEPRHPPAGLDYRPAYLEAVRHVGHLGAEVDYARFDFFWDGEAVYAGEITIYPAGGFSEILNPEVARMTLARWQLIESDFLRRRHQWPVSMYAAALRRAAEREMASSAETETLSS